MGKTIALVLRLFFSTEKHTAIHTDSKDHGNTDQHAKQVASTTKQGTDKETRLKQNQLRVPSADPLESVRRNSTGCLLDCHNNLNDHVQERVKLLFPEFFAPDASARLEQTANNLDESKYTDPIISSWLEMFGARRISVVNA